jgi:SPP1 gp7 family putative phage head morphogenesis protein
VAKVMRMDLLKDIREAVEKTLTEGTTYEQFRRELEPKLKAKGWWGRVKQLSPEGVEQEVTLGSPWRLKTIFRTNIQTAYAAGRWRQFEENKDKRPYLEYVAVLDGNTRPSHKVLDGKVFRVDDPIWRTMTPPLDWGCRCRLRALSAEDMEEDGKKLSNSRGTLSQEERLVSEATGELRPVTVYQDPKSGKRVSTAPGFDYNPGMRTFAPDPKAYPPDLMREYRKAKPGEEGQRAEG